MLHLIHTDSKNEEFIELVKELDADLAIRDGDEHDFYDQFNKSCMLKNMIVIYDDKKPLGCGALKEYAPKVAEIKRMFVLPEERKKGYASLILKELESLAAESGYEKCILETGVNQFEAIGLYKRNGYMRMENYPPYEKMKNSFCFQKLL